MHIYGTKIKHSRRSAPFEGQPAGRQGRQGRHIQVSPPTPSLRRRQAPDSYLGTVVAASATAAVKLASRPPSCLEPSPLGEAWGRRGRGGGRGKRPRNHGRDTAQPRCVVSGPAATVGSVARSLARYRSSMRAALSLMCRHELTHFAVIIIKCPRTPNGGRGMAAGEEQEKETGR